MSPLLSYRPSLNAITDKANLLANEHIEIKNVLLEACRKYGSKGLNNDFLSLENSIFWLKFSNFSTKNNYYFFSRKCNYQHINL
jgi:hypothetical protein